MAANEALNELFKKAVGESLGARIAEKLAEVHAIKGTEVLTPIVPTESISGSDTVDESDLLGAINGLENLVNDIIDVLVAIGASAEE